MYSKDNLKNNNQDWINVCYYCVEIYYKHSCSIVTKHSVDSKIVFLMHGTITNIQL